MIRKSLVLMVGVSLVCANSGTLFSAVHVEIAGTREEFFRAPENRAALRDILFDDFKSMQLQPGDAPAVAELQQLWLMALETGAKVPWDYSNAFLEQFPVDMTLGELEFMGPGERQKLYKSAIAATSKEMQARLARLPKDLVRYIRSAKYESRLVPLLRELLDLKRTDIYLDGESHERVAEAAHHTIIKVAELRAARLMAGQGQILTNEEQSPLTGLISKAQATQSKLQPPRVDLMMLQDEVDRDGDILVLHRHIPPPNAEYAQILKELKPLLPKLDPRLTLFPVPGTLIDEILSENYRVGGSHFSLMAARRMPVHYIFVHPPPDIKWREDFIVRMIHEVVHQSHQTYLGLASSSPLGYEATSALEHILMEGFTQSVTLRLMARYMAAQSDGNYATIDEIGTALMERFQAHNYTEYVRIVRNLENALGERGVWLIEDAILYGDIHPALLSILYIAS